MHYSNDTVNDTQTLLSGHSPLGLRFFIDSTVLYMLSRKLFLNRASVQFITPFLRGLRSQAEHEARAS